MAALPKTLSYGLGAEFQDLAHKRVAHSCSDGALRLLERVTDEAALVPHEAVVLKGREIVGWAMRDYCAHADRLFERGLEIIEEGGKADPIECSVEFFVPSSLKWRSAFFGDIRLPLAPLQIRTTYREPQKREHWSSRNFVESQEWDYGFAFNAESGFGGLRVCTVERKFGSRGADLGPQVVERFLAPPYGGLSRWWITSSTVQLEHAREEWNARMAKMRTERVAGASV